MPTGAATPHRAGGRRHLQVVLDRSAVEDWRWETAKACDRRAFMRGAVLNASISLGPAGSHVEFVFREERRARLLRARLREVGVRAGILARRGRSVVYVKGQEEVATLLRLTGANRALLDFEAGRVQRDVRNRLNRLLNAEEANVDRTVRAADRQLQAIQQLDAGGGAGAAARWPARGRRPAPASAGRGPGHARLGAGPQPVGDEPPPAAAGGAGRRPARGAGLSGHAARAAGGGQLEDEPRQPLGGDPARARGGGGDGWPAGADRGLPAGSVPGGGGHRPGRRHDRARRHRHRRPDHARGRVRRLHRRDLAADAGRPRAVRDPGPLRTTAVRQRDRCGGRGQGRLRGRPRAGADRGHR